MHQPSQTQRGVHERSAFTHIHPLLQLFLQPQWTSSFQLTTTAGSYGNPSQLQAQKRVSNIWKVVLHSLGSFLSGADEEWSMLCGTPTRNNGRQTKRLYKQMTCPVRIFPVPIRTPKVPLTSKVTTAVRTNSDYGRVSHWKHDRLDTFLYCVGHMDHHSLDVFFTQVRWQLIGQSQAENKTSLYYGHPQVAIAHY